jgi:disulfide bond formation protein DsbB
MTNNDTKTRAWLAYGWSAFVMASVGYIIVVHGREKEILTLLIGFITGVISTIFGVYFAASHTKGSATPDGETTTDISATITTTNNPAKEDEEPKG